MVDGIIGRDGEISKSTSTIWTSITSRHPLWHIILMFVGSNVENAPTSHTATLSDSRRAFVCTLGAPRAREASATRVSGGPCHFVEVFVEEGGGGPRYL